MGQNVREQVNDIFASLKKGETFSPEMTELIKKELYHLKHIIIFGFSYFCSIHSIYL